MTPRQLEDLMLDCLVNKNVEHIQNINNQIDDFFGIKHLRDSSLEEGLYGDVHQDALSTPYCDYYQILNDLPIGNTLVDLGAGYCRGTLLAEFLDLNECMSVESQRRRVSSAISFLSGKKAQSLIKSCSIESLAYELTGFYYLYFPRNIAFYTFFKSALLASSKNTPQTFYVCESHGDMLVFLDSLQMAYSKEQKISCSLPRHFSKIVKYEFREPLKEASILENTSLWFMHHFDSDETLRFEYFHQILKRKVELLIPIRNLNLTLYNGSFIFQHKHTNRMIDPHREFKFIGFVDKNSKNTVLSSILNNQKYQTYKILLTPDLMLESKCGKLTNSFI